MTKCLLAFIFALMVTGCLRPVEPPQSFFLQVQSDEFGLKTYTYSKNLRGRNAVFLAADATLQNNFKNQLSNLYSDVRVPRLEDVAWWQFSRYMGAIYDQVIVIPFNKVKHRTLVHALEVAESWGDGYDVFILSHGLPGHLGTGEGGYFLSWRELASLEGKLPNLRLVFMQACYSTDLAPDWHKTGAKHVVAFEGLNYNFFYIDLFLRFLRFNAVDIPQTYHNSLATDWYVQNDLQYYFVLKYMGLTPNQYVEISEDPQLTSAP